MECAYAEFGAGRCMLAMGEADDAARLLGRAHESFSGMGADFLAREIALWLSKVGAA